MCCSASWLCIQHVMCAFLPPDYMLLGVSVTICQQSLTHIDGYCLVDSQHCMLVSIYVVIC